MVGDRAQALKRPRDNAEMNSNLLSSVGHTQRCRRPMSEPQHPNLANSRSETVARRGLNARVRGEYRRRCPEEPTKWLT